MLMRWPPLNAAPGGPCRARGQAAWAAPAGGLTLVELAVTLALMAFLMKLAAPAFTTWTRNAQVRATSEGVQGVLRQAQAEAASRSRQVVVFRTTPGACDNATASSASGLVLAVRTVAMVAGDAVDTVLCSRVADSALGLTLSGPRALCFSSTGRLAANAAPGVSGAMCDAPAVGVDVAFDLAANGADRPLRVLVSPSGMVRACDPARSLANGQPDGCPA